jgi:1-acyl-sn-glycerol-3-phosphate acyltransferase
MSWLVDPEVRARVERLDLEWNRYGFDPYGTSQADLARFFTALQILYRRYFRVTVGRIDAVPPRGRAMLVGNHSGGWAVDALIVLASVFFDLEPPRLAHGMAEKFLSRLPFASSISCRLGQLTGLPENALRLLEDERLLMVFPEGARGTAKLFPERNSLVRFGSGFMRLAIETRSPIVPFGFAGGGEAIPTVLNLYRLGRLIGVPYIPVTPYLFPLPRPGVRLHVEYGDPMTFAGTGREDDETIERFVEEVKERIALLVERAVAARRGQP